jgi:hypothetical protein
MQTEKKNKRKPDQVHVKIVCPWWGRFEVVQMHCRSMVKFMESSPYKMSYLAIISQEDPDFRDLRDLAFGFNFDVCSHKNLPVSEKLNAGIELAMEDSPDYIMNMGSDDLCSAEIWDEYKPFIEKKEKFFGIDSCHIIDFYSKEAYYLDLYNDSNPVGVLRMIHTTCIKDLWTYYKLKPYPYGVNRGMDGASQLRLKRLGILPTVIHTAGRPFTTGVKHRTSINQFIHLSMLDKAKPVEYDSLKHLEA